MKGKILFHGAAAAALLCGLASCLLWKPTEARPWVMGYYVGYQADLQSPDQVDYQAMTHIALGAALPREDGSFDTSFYSDAVSGPAWARDTIGRAHAVGCKVILMLGGEGAVEAFRATADPAVRNAFAANLASIVADYGFDGVDLDWEPIEENATIHDRSNILSLVRAIRSALPGKVLTVPVGWNNANFDGMADPFWGELGALVDRLSIMSYQMLWCGAGWESWHSTALRGETPATPSSVDDSVKALIAAGVPAGKIQMGIGFYGQAYENGSWVDGSFVHDEDGPFVTGPRQPTENAEIRFSDNDLSYSNIMRWAYSAAARKWDDEALVPYLSWSQPIVYPLPAWADPPVRTAYITYEDEESIAFKADYAKDEGLGGVIIWTISQGYLEWEGEGKKDPLMAAVKASFLGR